MTSLKWRHNYIFEVRFCCHNQLKKTQFGQITEFQAFNIEGYGVIFDFWNFFEILLRAIFENLLLK